VHVAATGDDVALILKRVHTDISSRLLRLRVDSLYVQLDIVSVGWNTQPLAAGCTLHRRLDVLR